MWNYTYLTLTTLKTCKTKTFHRSSFRRTRDKKGHIQGHETLTYKVMLRNYNVDSCSFDSYDQNYIHTSTKFISLAYLWPMIWTVTWKLMWKGAWPWISRSHVTLTMWNWVFRRLHLESWVSYNQIWIGGAIFRQCFFHIIPDQINSGSIYERMYACLQKTCKHCPIPETTVPNPTKRLPGRKPLTH